MALATTAGLLANLALVAPSDASPRADRDIRLTDLVVHGAAQRLTDGTIRLISDEDAPVSGAAYTQGKQDVREFRLAMSFVLADACADGIAVLIQDDTAAALGAAGGYLGYGVGWLLPGEGIGRSLAVEVDTHANGAGDFGPLGVADPAVPHVSLQTRGAADNDANPLYSIRSRPIAEVADFAEHRATVRYNGTRLTVTIDHDRTMHKKINIAKRLGLSRGRAYVGVTSATAGCRPNTADLTAFRFS